jgi:hypothetical protein
MLACRHIYDELRELVGIVGSLWHPSPLTRPSHRRPADSVSGRIQNDPLPGDPPNQGKRGFPALLDAQFMAVLARTPVHALRPRARIHQKPPR